MDIEPLLAPLAGDAPCGPDLEYDSEYLELEREAQGKPEQVLGDNVVAGEPPNWSVVARLAAQLFKRTLDLRVAVLLARALLCTEGAPGLRDGLTLLTGLLDRHWAHLHPALDADDDHDPTMRLNTLAPLTDAFGMLRDLRELVVVRSPKSGPLTVRDILVVQGRLPAVGDAMPAAQVEGMLQEVLLPRPELADPLRAAADCVVRLQTLLNDKVGAGQAPDLSPLVGTLKAVVKALPAAAGAASAAAEPDAADQTGQAVPPSAPAGSGELRSREDAIRLLDRVCEFMERTEPSNPAPLFIRRAQGLMSKSFIDIIQDLAPDSLNRINELAGLPKK
ncbi:type VI secretion system protein TssA [Chitinivorax sp. PXF-14]|uniref:type VI secretion system protein TssA n=1 Tax=Chitinivorax sp. PXF-14 TaxID=3230488 RepID=UPI003465976E